MPWSWNESSHRYHDTTTGRFMGRDEVLGYVQQSLDAARTAPAITLSDGTLSTGTDLLSNLVGNGMLAPRDWHAQMREEIKQEYIRQYLLGRGGRAQMTSVDWGSIGGMLGRDQYVYLRKFAQEVAEGKLSEAQIRARSAMYISSAREAFERAHARVAEEAGYDKECWIVNPMIENCEDCLTFQAEGWQELGYFPTPADGSTRCLVNCGCHKEYRNSVTEAVWTG